MHTVARLSATFVLALPLEVRFDWSGFTMVTLSRSVDFVRSGRQSALCVGETYTFIQSSENRRTTPYHHGLGVGMNP